MHEVPERRPTCSLAVAVKSLKRAVTSLIVVLSVEKPAEPKVLALGSGFGLWAKNLWPADHALQSSGPMMVETEPGQVLVPTGLHSLRVPLEPALALAGSTVAGSGLDLDLALDLALATVATHSSTAADTEQTPTVVEADLALGPGATVVVGPEVVEPTVAAAGLLAELAVPKGAALGVFAVVASTVADDEAGFAAAVPMGPGAFAFVALEADPMLVTMAARSVVETAPMVAELVLALEGGPRLDEHGPGAGLAPRVDSMTAGSEGPMHLSALGAVLVPEGTDLVPKEAGMGIGLLLPPEAGLDATNGTTAAVVFALVPPPR